FRPFDLLDRHAIHPGRALVGSHPRPCFLQHIPPIDPVVQSVEPELRLLLGLLTQLLSQQRECIWPSVSAHLFLHGFDMQPLVRSGNLFQAALLSSYSSTISSKAPAESPRGFAPRGAHRSGLEPLDSSGSCPRMKAAAFRQDLSVPPVAG